DLTQGLDDGLADAAGAGHAQLARLRGLGCVERVRAQRISERRQSSPAVHFGLRPFGLQIVQNAGPSGHLPLVETQPGGQGPQRAGKEPQRAADANPAKTFVAHVFTGASPHSESGTGVVTETESARGAAPPVGMGMHRLLLTRGAFPLPRGFMRGPSASR